VLTREKYPSKFHRKKIMEVLKTLGVEKSELVKMVPGECWGVDTFQAGF